MMKNFDHSFVARYTAIVMILPMLFFGCAAIPTQYERRHVIGGEIVWGYDKELKVTKDGFVICGDNWDGLTQAVSGVPEAEKLAESAKHNRATGLALRWSSIPVMIGGFLLGLATLVDETDTHSSDSPLDYDGFWIMVGGMALGAAMSDGGYYYLQQGTADAIDAVNTYNCALENNPASSRVISPSENATGAWVPSEPPHEQRVIPDEDEASPASNLPDSSHFSVQLQSEERVSLFDNTVVLFYHRDVWSRSQLAFDEDVRISLDPGGPFVEHSIAVERHDTFYLEVHSLQRWRVQVLEENREGITLSFEEM
jgi:hypothetical protein